MTPRIGVGGGGGGGGGGNLTLLTLKINVISYPKEIISSFLLLAVTFPAGSVENTIELRIS